jgi:glycosyltransferase involved in cell wall biosynthesis
MLVPHEPSVDPRVGWIAEMFAQSGRTNVIGFTHDLEKPAREYQGNVYIERVLASEFGVDRILALLQLLDITLPIRLIVKPRATVKTLLWIAGADGRLWQSLVAINRAVVNSINSMRAIVFRSKVEEVKTDNSSPANEQPCLSPGSKPAQRDEELRADRYNYSPAGWYRRLLDSYREKRKFSGRRILESLYVISETLYRRARVESIKPWLIHATDLHALISAARLKRVFNCAVVYDSHEFWPEAFLRGGDWFKRVIKCIEGRYIKKADVVVTVNPHLAAHLEKLYGIKRVYSVPNAQPIERYIKPDFHEMPTFPLIFLLQGQVASNRGIEELLDVWSRLGENRAVLVLRCPQNNYLTYLVNKYQKEVEKDLIRVDSAVEEAALTLSASSADVGIIPYPGPNLNHVFACPNKLSQYMGAGLAILHHSDQQFVGELVENYKCGLSYNTQGHESLKNAVEFFVNSPEKLRVMKINAYNAVHTDYNWEQQSKIYRRILEDPYNL